MSGQQRHFKCLERLKGLEQENKRLQGFNEELQSLDSMSQITIANKDKDIEKLRDVVEKCALFMKWVTSSETEYPEINATEVMEALKPYINKDI